MASHFKKPDSLTVPEETEAPPIPDVAPPPSAFDIMSLTVPDISIPPLENFTEQKKEALLEAKDEIHNLRQETEKDLRERRAEVQRQEHRIQQKEEVLDRKTDALEVKEEKLSQRSKEIDARIEECDRIKQSQLDLLEKISGFTKEQAKSHLLEMLDGELTHEKAVKIMDFEQQTKEEADKIAKNIIAVFDKK